MWTGCVTLQGCVQHVAESCLQQRDGYVTKLVVCFLRALALRSNQVVGYVGCLEVSALGLVARRTAQ